MSPTTILLIAILAGGITALGSMRELALLIQPTRLERIANGFFVLIGSFVTFIALLSWPLLRSIQGPADLIFIAAMAGLISVSLTAVSLASSFKSH